MMKLLIHSLRTMLVQPSRQRFGTTLFRVDLFRVSWPPPQSSGFLFSPPGGLGHSDVRLVPLGEPVCGLNASVIEFTALIFF